MRGRGVSCSPTSGNPHPEKNSWARRERTMGVLGKVAAAKAVKGRRDDKKEKKEGEKTEEKKWMDRTGPGSYPFSPTSFQSDKILYSDCRSVSLSLRYVHPIALLSVTFFCYHEHDSRFSCDTGIFFGFRISVCLSEKNEFIHILSGGEERPANTLHTWIRQG